jgi:hypothetical protein
MDSENLLKCNDWVRNSLALSPYSMAFTTIIRSHDETPDVPITYYGFIGKFVSLVGLNPCFILYPYSKNQSLLYFLKKHQTKQPFAIIKPMLQIFYESITWRVITVLAVQDTPRLWSPPLFKPTLASHCRGEGSFTLLHTNTIN